MAYTFSRHLDTWVGLSTDTKPTGVGKGDSCYEFDTGNAYIYDGAGNWYIGSPQQNSRSVSSRSADLGKVIDTTLAAGAVYNGTPWLDNAEWVRYIVFMVQTDQAFSPVIYRRDHELVNDWGATQGQRSAPGLSQWDSIHYSYPVGYGVRVGIKNGGAASGTFRVRAQLLGQ